jgi:hypothetical protein
MASSANEPRVKGYSISMKTMKPCYFCSDVLGHCCCGWDGSQNEVGSLKSSIWYEMLNRLISSHLYKDWKWIYLHVL